jgi:gamma-glutamyltranspeptidase
MSLKRFQFVTLAMVAVVTVLLTQSSDCSDSSNQKRSGFNGAVASDSEVCSKIGADVIRDSGTAIDAAIATLVCLGLIHPHSSGIGGGGYMLLYKRATKTATYFDFRETAPGASAPDMFVKRRLKSLKGECWRQEGD